MSVKFKCLVIDTNVLLDHLDTLSRFVNDIQSTRQASRVKIFIPGIVIDELDNQKPDAKLGWASRRASRWILKCLREVPSLVTCQTHKEASPTWKDGTNLRRTNDDLIIEYAFFIAKSDVAHSVFLCTSDTNLAIKAESKGLDQSQYVKAPITHLPPGLPWSSRKLAAQIALNDTTPSTDFAEHQETYVSLDDVMDIDEFGVPGNSASGISDPDAMDVDEDLPLHKMSPSEALRILHSQVVDHYTGLLHDLALRKNPTPSASASRWSPAWERKNVHSWDVKDCLDFFSNKYRAIPDTDRQALVSFLSHPYTKQTGARRGDQWSVAQWQNNLALLTKLGDDLDDKSFADSEKALDDPFHELFERHLRVINEH